MSIKKDIQSLNPSAEIELFELDLTAIDSNAAIIRFCNQQNALGGNVIWQGHTYLARPISADGFSMSSNGSPPRPKLQVANIDRAVTALCDQYQDLLGAKITRKRTLAKFLDAENFATGNDQADATAQFNDDIFYVERKVSETFALVEFELRWEFDLSHQSAPHRLVLQNMCTWQYKSEQCGWIPDGTYFDTTDNPCAASNDACSHKLKGCQLRFGQKAALSFGGFPTAAMARRGG